MDRLVAHLLQLEEAMAADDIELCVTLVQALVAQLGETAAAAIVRQLLLERATRRHNAALAVALMARFA